MRNNYYIDAPSYLEVTSNIADYVMRQKLGKDYNNYIYVNQGDINFTEEGQEIFNGYLEEIEGFFRNANILHESEKEI